MKRYPRPHPKPRVPHRRRELWPWTPHHIVLTVKSDVPPLHRRTIRNLFAVGISKTIEKYTDVSFSLGCMMRDHVHLVAQPKSDQAGISVAVQYLCAQLARLINRTYTRRGPVFRDRFFSRVLRTVSEVAGVLRYIGLNPVKAGLVKRPEHWLANGVRPYLGGYLEKSPWRFWGWIYRVLGFERDPQEALRNILDGTRKPIVHRGGRQLKLPFARGLPGGV